MKIGGIDVVDFIEQVPVLRLFARNLALSGGLAFIIHVAQQVNAEFPSQPV